LVDWRHDSPGAGVGFAAGMDEFGSDLHGASVLWRAAKIPKSERLYCCNINGAGYTFVVAPKNSWVVKKFIVTVRLKANFFIFPYPVLIEGQCDTFCQKD
jgi:hypothetical protein